MLENVKKLLEPSINELGFKLDDVIYEKEGSLWFLRVIIDNETLVTVDDCVTVCKKINPILDEADLIKDSYILDVCTKEKGND